MNNIQVTKSSMPPIGEYEEYLKQIWDNNQLTNNGPLSQQFEEKVTEYLGIDKKRFKFVANGTLALQLALRSLGITEGEVITTPFSYVATTSAILWEGCSPVYVDIDPYTLNIDPTKIEAAITPDTKAILAVHVFGNPCDVYEIEKIAQKHSLKVIYDAAHAFDVKLKGRSIFEFGDISTTSFHATKLFHTIEGGGVYSKTTKTIKQVELLKRFGHDGEDHKMLGINAKATEFQAAMGLANLKYIKSNIKKRQRHVALYDHSIMVPIQKQSIDKDVSYNYAYYPIILKDQKTTLNLQKTLNKKGIFARRYFYPSLNELPYLNNLQRCPVSEDIASRILCLPLYSDLTTGAILEISEVVNAR